MKPMSKAEFVNEVAIDLANQIVALKAEMDRYRKALERIANADGVMDGACQAVAREALKASEVNQ